MVSNNVESSLTKLITIQSLQFTNVISNTKEDPIKGL